MVSKIHTKATINIRTVGNIFANLCVKIIGEGYLSAIRGSLVVAPRNDTVLEGRFSHTVPLSPNIHQITGMLLAYVTVPRLAGLL